MTFIDPLHAWTLHCEEHTCVDSFRATDDGGDTWETRPLPHDASLSSFLTADLGWATRIECGAPSAGACTTAIFSTIDGGRTWDEVGRAPGGVNYTTLTFTNATRGWVTTYDHKGGRILVTMDGGRTWTPERAIDGYSSFGGFVKAADRIWLLTAVGFQGGSDRSTIYRRDFAPEPAPPPAKPRVRPPNTGSGGQGGDTEYSTVVVLLSIAGVLAVGAWALVKRRGA